jgi:hypothetical protein
MQMTKANAKGSFQFVLTVGLGSITLRLGATGKGHQPAAATLTVSRFAPPPVPPTFALQRLTPRSLARTEVVITGNVAGTGVTSLTAIVDGSPAGLVAFDSAGNFSHITQLLLYGSADGPHDLQFFAVDGTGNTARSATESFTRDTRPPTVSVSSPAAGALETGNVVVSGRVLDAISGAAALNASVDRGAFQPVALLADGTFALTTTLALDGSADGMHQVRFVATDQVGNTSAPTNLHFILETQGPVLSLAAPPPITATNPTITGHVADPLSGILDVMAQVNVAPAIAVPVDAAGNFAFTPTLELDGSNDGPNTVEFLAVNGAVKTTGQSASFTLDTQAPVITATAPAAGAMLGASPTITGRVSDPTSGVATLQAQVDCGTPMAVNIDATGNFSFHAGSLADGAHTIHLGATDRAGNATGTDLSFTLANQAPTISILSPATGVTTSTNLTVTFFGGVDSGSRPMTRTPTSSAANCHGSGAGLVAQPGTASPGSYTLSPDATA